MNKKTPTAKSTPPTDSDKSWLTHAQKEKQEAPKRLEDIAKFLVGIISISLTFFISKRPEGLEATMTDKLAIATIIWFLAMGLSFLVLFPWRYRFDPESPEDIERAYGEITTWKYGFLVLSVAAYAVAMGIVGWVFIGAL